MITTFDGGRLEKKIVRPVDEANEAARKLVGCGAVLSSESVVIVNPRNARGVARRFDRRDLGAKPFGRCRLLPAQRCDRADVPRLHQQRAKAPS